MAPEERTEVQPESAAAHPSARTDPSAHNDGPQFSPARAPSECTEVLREEAPLPDRTDAASPGNGQPDEKTVLTDPPTDPPGLEPTEIVAMGERPGALTEHQSPREAADSGILSKGAPRVAGYELVERLGEGTYGVVWRARDVSTGIEVAIKFFAHGTDQQWELLQAEVKQLALLHADPGIVQLIDVEPSARPPYYIMAYLPKGSLDRRLKNGPVPLAEAERIFRRVTEALKYVHVKGVRHCDLKPGNILLDALGCPRIADFGQAHLCSDASPALGTFFYMAPEQADLTRQIPDTRWDVYGLGALFYAMLTGQPPRADTTVRGQLENTVELSHRLRRYREAVLRAPRPAGHRRLPGMDRALAEILDRCLEVDPAKRFTDAAAVLAALERRDRQRKQRPLLLFGVLAPILLLCVMAAFSFWQGLTALDNSRQALTTQLLDSNRLSARMVANVIQEKVRVRMRLVEKEARREALVEAARKGDRAALQKLLEDLHKEQFSATVSRWTVADAQGNILACHPHDPTIIGKNFSWRDWFNGRGDQSDNKEDGYESAGRTHVSQPFIGQTRQRKLLIGVSTPIFHPAAAKKDDAPREIVGVLMSTIEVARLHEWLIGVEIEHGCIVLLNERGHCLLHEDAALEAIRPQADRNPPEFLGRSDLLRDLVVRRTARAEAEHVDPVNGRTYLAAGAPCPDGRIGWVAVVQHERAMALRPIEDLKAHLLLWGCLAFAVLGLLLSGLWGWLLWSMRRGERLAHG
jgi:hypothetical protein